MRYCLWFCLILASAGSPSGFATEHTVDSRANEPQSQIVEYPASFFVLYQPNTALDMVKEIPGFLLDDGRGSRGFAGAAGNILINGRRPSAKQDSLSAILARIPASQVEYIELIRGQVRGVDLRGQPVVANVLLNRDDIPAAIQWQAYVQQSNRAPIRPGGSISISDNWNNIDYIAGVVFGRNTSGYSGPELEYDSDGTLTKQGKEKSTETGYSLRGITLTASSWLGEVFAQLNTRVSFEDAEYQRPSSSTNLLTGVVQDVLIMDKSENLRFEVGFDLERNLSHDLAGKTIILFTNGDLESTTSRRNNNSVSGQTLFRLADASTITRESIARLELDWTGLPGHSFQFNLEGAYNFVDGSLVQTDDRGAGPLNVEIPGANTRVEEVRGDILLKDTWNIGQFELDYGLAAETSSIKQSGDEEQNRTFTFLKPMASLTYSAEQGQHFQLRVEREVSQLNFNDFISATVFEDDNLALGNPNLSPETTWVTELGYEHRFSQAGVMKVTGFYHWISDVLDLLPLTATDAVPGNIGDGRRWGAVFENSMPLDSFGLTGSRLGITARWQDSKVTDPVTGEYRILSGEGGQTRYVTLANRNKNNKYFFRLDYRQDFELSKVAWGWSVAERAKRPLYKVNEYDVYNEDFAIDFFVETTRWFGFKMKILVENLLDDPQRRERTIYTGRREISPVDYRFVGSRHIGRRITFTGNGNF